MTPRLLQLLALTSLSVAGFAYEDDEEFIEEFFDDEEIAYISQSDSETPPSSDEEHRVQYQLPYQSARPQFADQGVGLFFSGDFLYWQAEEGGLAYAIATPFDGTVTGTIGKVSRLQPGYEPGYRLKSTYQLPYDQWDLSFSWVRYQASTSSHLAPSGDVGIFPFWLCLTNEPVGIASQATSKAHWKLNFNTLDFNVGRMFQIGEHFSIKPYLGFKAAWIEQKLTAFYGDLNSFSSFIGSVRSKNRCNFQGYGAELGIDGKWDLGAGFDLFGAIEGALFWGNFDIAMYEKNNGVAPELRSSLSNHLHEVIPELGAAAGVSWERNFFSDRLYLNIHVAWEEQIWFRQNQMTRFADTYNLGKVINHLGNLTLSGWTIGATLGF
jgi:hypothetical protein